jgi:hypothetical protein
MERKAMLTRYGAEEGGTNLKKERDELFKNQR